jgi:hypothetical protein
MCSTIIGYFPAISLIVIKEVQSGGTVDWEQNVYGGNLITTYVHCKYLPHENYGDWELRGPCSPAGKICIIFGKGL